MGKAAGDAAFLCKGHQEEKGKIQETCQKSPEKAACFHKPSGDQTAQKAGQDIDGADGEADLGFRKAEFIEGKGERGKQQG